MFEGFAFEEFHHDEGLAVTIFADFVDGADVGMVEGSGCAGFAQKAIEGELVRRASAERNLRATERSRTVSRAE